MIRHTESKQVAVKETAKEIAVREAAQAVHTAAVEALSAASRHLDATVASVKAANPTMAGAERSAHPDVKAAYRAYLDASDAAKAAQSAVPARKTRTVRTAWTEY